MQKSIILKHGCFNNKISKNLLLKGDYTKSFENVNIEARLRENIFVHSLRHYV